MPVNLVTKENLLKQTERKRLPEQFNGGMRIF